MIVHRMGEVVGRNTVGLEQDDIRIVFRDVKNAKVLVSGVSAAFETAGISVVLDPEKGLEVILESVEKTVNLPKEELKTNLLTRVQGEVIWKNAVLNSQRKQPSFVREALSELDGLLYE